MFSHDISLSVIFCQNCIFVSLTLDALQCISITCISVTPNTTNYFLSTHINLYLTILFEGTYYIFTCRTLSNLYLLPFFYHLGKTLD